MKSVIEAILVHLMGCFQLLKKVIDDISREISCFWWGSLHTYNKIHWLTWETLFYLPKKHVCEMRFRVWKSLPSIHVLKILRENSKEKGQRGQYLLAVCLDCYKNQKENGYQTTINFYNTHFSSCT